MPIITLSAEFVRTVTCPAGKKKENYYDASITGFILEVRASGGKTYALRYRDSHDRQIQQKIGDSKSISFDKAKTAAKLIRSRVVLGEDPATEKRKKRDVPTLAEYWRDKYYPHSIRSKRSSGSDLSIYRNHLMPKFGTSHLDEINQQSVLDYYHELLAKEYAKATCNRVLVLLRNMYNMAKKWKIAGAEINPVADIKLVDPNNAKERFLTSDEAKRLHVELEKSGNPQLKNIVSLLLLLGCRFRELLDSRWHEFDLERRSWRIPMSKSGKARHVPLSQAALSVLSQLPRWEGCQYVVPNPDTLKPYTSVFRTWNTARKNAGLPEVRIHDLRHSAASYMINAGRSIYEVAKVLGHAQLKTTSRYAHLSQETLLAAVDAAATATGIDWSHPQEAKVA